MMQISFLDEAGTPHCNIDVESAKLDGSLLTYRNDAGDMRRTHVASECISILHKTLNGGGYSSILGY